MAIGGLFAGESMFHREPEAGTRPRWPLVALVELLSADGVPDRLLDVQWCTPHLATLGVVEVPRAEYLARLEVALARPVPAGWSQPPSRTR